MTLAEFVAHYRIRATCTTVDRNPNVSDDDWARTATHWRVRLYCGANRRSYTTWFSQGAAHAAEPSAVDVLSCLRMDAGAGESDTFEAWAADLGYNPDSRKAERTWRLCQVTARRLRAWLGEEGFTSLVAAEDS